MYITLISSVRMQRAFEELKASQSQKELKNVLDFLDTALSDFNHARLYGRRDEMRNSLKLGEYRRHIDVLVGLCLFLCSLDNKIDRSGDYSCYITTLKRVITGSKWIQLLLQVNSTDYPVEVKKVKYLNKNLDKLAEKFH